MVDFKKLGDRAKELIDKRGGTEGLKEDAAELKDIARGEGSLADKAKAAAAAIKEEGAAGEETPEATGKPQAAEKPEAAAKPQAAEKPEAADEPKSAGEPEAPTGP